MHVSLCSHSYYQRLTCHIGTTSACSEVEEASCLRICCLRWDLFWLRLCLLGDVVEEAEWLISSTLSGIPKTQSKGFESFDIASILLFICSNKWSNTGKEFRPRTEIISHFLFSFFKWIKCKNHREWSREQWQDQGNDEENREGLVII